MLVYPPLKKIVKYNKNLIYCCIVCNWRYIYLCCSEGPSWCDRMVFGFTTTCAISAYHHWSCEFESLLWSGVLDTALCDKVCQWLVAGQWFSPGTPPIKLDCHNLTEILFKVAVNTLTLTLCCSIDDILFSILRWQR